MAFPSSCSFSVEDPAVLPSPVAHAPPGLPIPFSFPPGLSVPFDISKSYVPPPQQLKGCETETITSPLARLPAKIKLQIFGHLKNSDINAFLTNRSAKNHPMSGLSTLIELYDEFDSCQRRWNRITSLSANLSLYEDILGRYTNAFTLHRERITALALERFRECPTLGSTDTLFTPTAVRSWSRSGGAGCHSE